MAEAQHEEPVQPRKEGNGADHPRAPSGEEVVVAEKKSRRNRFVLTAAAAVALLVALLWWLHARKFEDTDDAQVDGYITSVSSRVAGNVLKVLVQDNQPVKEGDALVELDTADLEVALAQARANVAQAEAAVAAEQPNVSITATSNKTTVQAAEDEVANAQADLEAARRDLDQAIASNRFAQQQKERASQLVASDTIPQAEYDQRVSAADVAQAGVEAAHKHVDQRQARLQTAQARQVEAKANAPR